MTYHVDKIDCKEDLAYVLKNSEIPLTFEEIQSELLQLNERLMDQGTYVFYLNVKAQLDTLVKNNKVFMFSGGGKKGKEKRATYRWL